MITILKSTGLFITGLLRTVIRLRTGEVLTRTSVILHKEITLQNALYTLLGPARFSQFPAYAFYDKIFLQATI